MHLNFAKLKKSCISFLCTYCMKVVSKCCDMIILCNFVEFQIKNLIQKRDKPVQLTVEHEPAVLIRSRSMNFFSHMDSSFLPKPAIPKCSLSHRPAEQKLRRSSSLPRSFIRYLNF